MLNPPVALTRPHTHDLHGDRRDDPYFWLRDKADPAVRAYLEAENAYADQVLAPIADFRESLYQEMLGRIKQTDLSKRGSSTPSIAASAGRSKGPKRCCST